MFHPSSPYSPFFNSGFLSESLPSRQLPNHRHSRTRRRDSLSRDPDSSALANVHLEQTEFLSFLSLDHTDSTSLHASSTSITSSRDPSLPGSDNPTSESPNPYHPTIRLRRSRDSMRTIPSPKPVPSIILPEPPKSAPPSLSTQPPSAFDLPESHNSSLLLSLPQASSRSNNRYSTSTVTTSVRKVNRSQALARLEGRFISAFVSSKEPSSAPNFMSMTDDEDEETDDHSPDESHPFNGPFITLSAVLSPQDVVVSLPRSKHALTNSKLSTSIISSRGSDSSHATKDWFRFKSFLDFKDDDLARWSRKSFPPFTKAA